MSWITGLVDKAENILDKLDQNAATALQNQGNPASSSVSCSMLSTEAHQSIPNTTELMKDGYINGTQYFSSPSIQTSQNIVAVTKTESNFKTTAAGTAQYLERLQTRNTSFVEHIPRSSKSDLVAIGIDAAIPSSSITAQTVTDKVLISTISKASDVGENQDLKVFKIAPAEVACDTESSNLKKKYNELLALAQSLTAERNQLQSQLTDAKSSISAYMLLISELESNLSKSNQNNLEHAQKLQMQIKETAQQRQDLEDYRRKAQRALQIKDNLISELKSSLSGRSVDESRTATNELCTVKIDLNNVKQELQSLREEKVFLLQHLDEARKELKDSSLQHSAIVASMLSKEDALNKAIRLEKQHSMKLESEQRVHSQELTTLRQQLSNQMAATATKFQDNAKLMRPLKLEDKISCEVHEGYNMRLKSLTEALVDKQNCVELITADRNALRIQLEKVQDQLQQISFHSNSSNRGQRNILLSNTTDDVKAQFPLLMKETPFDNRVARRVKRVYSSLDSAGIRLGAFLRRYPLMRIVVLMYVGLLHIWVIFVLLSSTPT